MKKKLTTIVTLMFVIFSQLIQPVQIIFAESIGDALSIKEVESDLATEAVFEIESKEKDKISKIEIELPIDTTLDLEKTKKLNVDDNAVSYNDSSHTVVIDSLTGTINKSTLALKNVGMGEHRLIFKSFEGEESVSTVTHRFIREPVAAQQAPPPVSAESDEEVMAPNNETAPALQRDLRIEQIKKNVDAGDDALFKLTLKTTGSQIRYNQARIEVQLPAIDNVVFEQDLSELVIADQMPVYDKDRHMLIYDFDTLESGQTYEKILKLKTKNGVTVNGTTIAVSSKLILNENGEVQTQEDNASLTVIASNAVAVSKKVIKSQSVPQPGGNVQWEIKVSIPKKELGQMYLKPGSKNTVVDTLPQGMKFVKAIGDTPKPVAAGQNLTWSFDAPTLSEQEQSSDELFTKVLRFETQVLNNSKYVGTLTNEVTVGAIFVDNKVLAPAAKTSANVVIGESTPTTGEIKGGIVVPVHYGPLDNKGISTGNNANNNPNPLTYDDGYLKFKHGIWGYYYAAHHDLKSFVVEYKVDDNLILDKLRTPGHDDPRFGWFFARNNAELDQKIPLPVQPQYDIKLYYVDAANKSWSKTITDPEQGVVLTRKDLRLRDSDRVTHVIFDFKGRIPAGLALTANASPEYFFTIKKGFVGQVENRFNMKGETTYNRLDPKETDSISMAAYTPGVYRKFDFRKHKPKLYEGTSNLTGDRYATVIKQPANQAPTAQIGIQLLDQQAGVVQTGDNRLKITYMNNAVSPVTIKEKLESVVLLPPGVTIKSDPKDSYTDNNKNDTTGTYEVISSNYNGSGRQLVKVTWDEDRIKIGNNVSAELDVTISKNSPSSLYFDVYGFSGDKVLKVPNTSGDSITNTILQTNNSDDLNNDGKKDSVRIKSSNIYSLVGEYDLQAEKLVRNNAEEEWGSLAKVEPGGDFEYKLHMTNTTGKNLSTMTLIDVLPSVGDLGITDNISRGSKFTPSLKGPITLPSEWQGKVNVYYSSAKNPKRDDLIRHTNYPEGTVKLTNPAGATEPNWKGQGQVTDWSTIHSFKVELLPGATWIKGVDMDITYTMTAPEAKDITTPEIFDRTKELSDRTACNSFAVATDTGQPVEPYQVCVYMDFDGSFSLTKVASENNSQGEVQTLAGAEFNLLNQAGEIVAKLVSDQEGNASVSSLPLGDYTLVETKAPAGYNLLKKPIQVKITNQASDVKLVVKNSKQGWELPTTGGLGGVVFYTVGSLMMLVGVALFSRFKGSSKQL